MKSRSTVSRAAMFVLMLLGSVAFAQPVVLKFASFEPPQATFTA